MVASWLQIRVGLIGGRGESLDPAPGRIFICGPGHSLGELADAINGAFARWDRSHLHGFELADGRRIGFPDDEFGPELVWLDQDELEVVSEVEPGEEFSFTFNLGDDWEHRCRVMSDKIDPGEEWGPGTLPEIPVPSGAGARSPISTDATRRQIRSWTSRRSAAAAAAVSRER